MATHIITYDREQDVEGTGCGMPPTQIAQLTPTERTSDSQRVTCPKCKAYLKRTGNGPESLKGLLRW